MFAEYFYGRGFFSGHQHLSQMPSAVHHELVYLYPNEIKMRVTDFERSPERLSTKAYGAPLDSHLPASSRTLGIYPKDCNLLLGNSK